jgi:exopolyphosphatase / guanosine-5'-triphosphate,3'-diphosphate pyrophosphatase
MERRAVIDIGTNSVKVLVADVAAQSVSPVWEAAAQTRLGAGFYAEGALQPGPVADTAAAVARFEAEARRLGAASIRILATSAARDASNPALLSDAVQHACGRTMDIITGDSEAAWAFCGASSLPGLTNSRILVIDVGGGSTELAVGAPGALDHHTSVRLGAVRLLETIPPGDPPQASALAASRSAARTILGAALLKFPKIQSPPALGVGVGGAMAILAKILGGRNDMDRAWLDAAEVSPTELTTLVERLWSMPLAARRILPGLPSERADVILGGAVIYEAVVAVFGLPRIRVSTRGLRFGALLA